MQRSSEPHDLYFPEAQWFLNTRLGLDIDLRSGYTTRAVNKSLVIERPDNMRIKIDLYRTLEEFNQRASELVRSIEHTLHYPKKSPVLTIFEDKNGELPVFSLDASKLPRDDITLLEILDGELKSLARTPNYVLVLRSKNGKIDFRNYGFSSVSDLQQYFKLQRVPYQPQNPKEELLEQSDRIEKSRTREFLTNFAEDAPLEDDFDEETIDNFGYGIGYIVRQKD